MIRVTMGHVSATIGAVAMSAALMVPSGGRCRRRAKDADLHQRHRADLPGKVRSLPPARFDRADVAEGLLPKSRPWVRSIRARVADRQMPPWQIDRNVGIQKFKNDRSLTDEQVATILRWADAGAPQGDPKDMPKPKAWPEDQGWNFAPLFGQKEPDLIIKSYPFTMPAVSQDAWDKRVTPSGITEPRWVRAIEIRPETLKGRRITHHAIAYLQQEEPGAQNNSFLPAPFMEWAVGKQGEMMRPDTGKLLLPGSKFHVGYPLLAGG